jgi:hypothetical protein
MAGNKDLTGLQLQAQNNRMDKKTTNKINFQHQEEEKRPEPDQNQNLQNDDNLDDLEEIQDV